MSDETESASPSPGETGPESRDDAGAEPQDEAGPRQRDDTGPKPRHDTGTGAGNGTAEPAGAREPSGTTAAAAPTDAAPPAEEEADASGGFDLWALARGVLGFFVAASYTVFAAVASLMPPVLLVGATLNVAVWTGVVVVGLVAAAWLGFDVGRGDRSLRRIATFAGTAWLLLLPLGVVVEDVVVPFLAAGLGGVYVGRVLVFVLATVGAVWMAYGGGWDRVRARLGAGGLENQ